MNPTRTRIARAAAALLAVPMALSFMAAAASASVVTTPTQHATLVSVDCGGDYSCYAPPYTPPAVPNPCLYPQDAHLCAPPTTAPPTTWFPEPTTTVAPAPPTTVKTVPPVTIVVSPPTGPVVTIPPATGSALPFTGAGRDTAVVVLIGLILLGAGGLLWFATRK